MVASKPIIDLVRKLSLDPFGVLFLANAIDSVDEGLVDASFVRNLFEDLDDELSMISGSRWPDGLARLCSGAIPSTRQPGGYLRAGNLKALKTHQSKCWTTVVSAAVWQTKHLDTSSVGYAPLSPFPPFRDPLFGKRFYDRMLDPDWFRKPTHRDGAWLGRPASEGANCWVSCEDLDATSPEVKPRRHVSARRVAESLGLLPKSPLSCYIRYYIDADIVRGDIKADALRPTFSDQGNEWFRVRNKTLRGSHYRKHGWGSTVDISALRDKHSDHTGRPERVTPSIPISSKVLKKVELLFPLPKDKDKTSIPRDRFNKYLLRGRSVVAIEATVLQLWNNP